MSYSNPVVFAIDGPGGGLGSSFTHLNSGKYFLPFVPFHSLFFGFLTYEYKNLKVDLAF